MFKISKKTGLVIIAVFLFLVIISFFDKALAIGTFFIIFLSGITFFTLSKIGIKDKTLISLFLIVFLIYLSAVLFVHYTQFYPFGGGEGDGEKYHRAAVELSQRFRQGNFSLQGIGVANYYPVILGWLYAITLPEMIIGKLLNVWLAAVSAILVYLVVLEINNSKRNAFFGGLLVAIYPSYLYYSSLLLREGFVVSLALFSVLFTIKLIKNFSWKHFFIFYTGLGLLIHFRFYIGFAFFPAFIISIPLITNLNLKKKIIYGIIIIILLGFLPQIFSNQGYYGLDVFKQFLKPETVVFYRETAYNYVVPSQPSPSQPSPSQPSPSQPSPSQPSPSQPSPSQPSESGIGSSTVLKTDFTKPLTLIKDYFKSFTNVFLGPFPWQIKYLRQLFVLPDTIFWYFLLIFIIKGLFCSVKNKKIKFIIPIIIFSFSVIGLVAIFEAGNFGIYTRIRMPAFLALLCLAPLGFGRLKSIKIPFLNI